MKQTDELILSTLNYVKSLSRKYPEYMREDICSEGFVVLCKKAKEYNPNFGYKFTTFITPHLKKVMADYANNYTSNIKLSENIHRENKKIYDAKSKLTSKLNRAPTLEELSIFCNMSKEQIQKINSIYENHKTTSLDKIIGNNTTLMQLVTTNDTSEKRIIYEELHEKILELSEIERKVINIYLNNFNFAEIGRKLNLSREYIRQIYQKAIAKLQFSYK